MRANQKGQNWWKSLPIHCGRWEHWEHDVWKMELHLHQNEDKRTQAGALFIPIEEPQIFSLGFLGTPSLRSNCGELDWDRLNLQPRGPEATDSTVANLSSTNWQIVRIYKWHSVRQWQWYLLVYHGYLITVFFHSHHNDPLFVERLKKKLKLFFKVTVTPTGIMSWKISPLSINWMEIIIQK